MKALLLICSLFSISAFAQKQIDLNAGDSINISPSVRTTVTCSGEGVPAPQVVQKCVCYEVEDPSATWYYKTKAQLVHVTKFTDGRVESKLLKEFDSTIACQKQANIMLECRTEW